MNIERVKIKNFKNYVGLHEFDLGKKVTIFYGSNGFGKSSFFDAIEWCLTGTISRFKDFHEKDVLTHFATVDNQCYVEILFSGFTITRKFKKEGKVVIALTTSEGKIFRSKKAVDKYLCHKHYGEKSGKARLFGGLLKQSHILSQDQVTEFVLGDDPKKRFDSLADIMGLKNLLYLLDNSRSILNKIISKKQKVQLVEENYSLLIEAREKDIIAVDEDKLFKISSALRLEDIDEKNIFSLVSQLQQGLTKNLHELSSIINLCEIINKQGYQTLYDAENRCNELQEEINTLQNRIEGLTRLRGKVVKLKDDILGQRGLFEKIVQIDNEIKRKESILIQNGIQEFDQIKVEKTLLEKWDRLKKIEYAVSYNSEYLNLTNDLVDHPKELEALMKRNNFLQKRDSRVSKVLTRIDSLLVSTNDGAMVNLLDHVKSIFEYVQLNGDGHCPVCSAAQGELLIPNVQQNIETYAGVLKESAGYVSRLLIMKSRFENYKSESISECNRLKSKQVTLSIRLRNARERLDSISQNELFDVGLFSSEKVDQLTLENDELAKEINRIEEALTANRSIKKLKMERSLMVGTVGNSKMFSLEFISKRLDKLERAITRMGFFIVRKQDLKRIAQNNFESLYKQVALIPKEESLGFEKTESISHIISSFVEKREVIYDNLSFVLELKQTIVHNGRVEIKIKDLELEREKIEDKLMKHEDKIELIQTFVDNLGAELGNAAMDLLNASRSEIQRYYRYLNPLPTTAPVHFKGESGELHIMVQLEGSGNSSFSKAQHTLSSGQLNVLAIAIFLAINGAQKVSKLDFVAIDDPIQNMDDVNQFSICDILGNLDKQLIFSTHDINFVKLFVKKNEHKKGNMQLYFLESPRLTSEKIRCVTL